MRFVTYSYGGETAPGVVEDDGVRRISTRDPARVRRTRSPRTHRVAFGGRYAAAARRAPRSTASAAAQRLLRRTKLSRSREGGSPRVRARVEAPGRTDVLHEGADRDRRPRRDAPFAGESLLRIRLRSGASRRHRREVQGRLRRGCAARRFRLYGAQRRHRAQHPTRARPMVQGQEPRRKLPGRPVARIAATRSTSRST